MSNRLLRKLFMVSILAVSLTGCASLGPKSLGPDRIDYVHEISESWKQQMLLNIVKLRYFDPPTFLDVSSVINQYAIENQTNASGGWLWPGSGSPNGFSAGIGGYSRYSDKPTITYTPLSGQKFTKNLLTPIPPVAVVTLIQNGWPIDLVFFLTVKTVNGVHNGSLGPDSDNQKTDFSQLMQTLRTVQRSGVTDIRLGKLDEKETVLFVISDTVNQEKYQEETETIRRILKVKPEINSYKIVLGALAEKDDEIALLTRSVIEIMLEMAAGVEVPAKHITENRVNKSSVSSEGQGRLMRIHAGRDKPKDAFTAIRYQDYWFWVDNKDIQSKRNFALLMIFMSLTESENKSSAPLLSIGS